MVLSVFYEKERRLKNVIAKRKKSIFYTNGKKPCFFVKFIDKGA